jgi:hypothetical protein
MPWRSATLLPIAFGACSLATCLVALTPPFVDARAIARRAICANRLFQHSGNHEADTVLLDRDLQVTEVSSCPICSPPAGIPILCVNFFIEGELPRAISWFAIPETTRLEAMCRLDQYKRSEWFLEIRESLINSRRRTRRNSEQ